MLSKEIKTAIIDCLERKCRNTRLSDKSIGYILRGHHITTPTNFLIIALFAPIFWFHLIIIFMVISLCFYFIFGGCFLTKLEQRFCKDEFIFTDPFLELLGIEINKTTRYHASYIIGGSFMILTFFIYYYRFY